MEIDRDNANITTNLLESEAEADAYQLLNAGPPSGSAAKAKGGSPRGTIKGAAGGAKMERTYGQLDHLIRLTVTADDLGYAAAAIMSACRDRLPELLMGVKIGLFPCNKSSFFVEVRLERYQGDKSDLEEASRIMLALVQHMMDLGFEVIPL